MSYLSVAGLQEARGSLVPTPAHRTSADVGGIICGTRI